MSEWRRVGENLDRRASSGVYYLRLSVGGKQKRRSLRTKHLGTARERRDKERTKLRLKTGGAVQTIADAIAAEAARLEALPDRKESTRHYHAQLLGHLSDTLPPGRNWSENAAQEWWARFSSEKSAPRANATLRLCRRIARRMVAAGAWRSDPTKDLEPASVRQKALSVPSAVQMNNLLAEIRRVHSPLGTEESANMVEFLAWSGMRVAEARALRWEDVGDEWLTVTGGEQGTKNRKIRRVPVNQHLGSIIARMRHPESAGPVFSIQSPRFAIRNACDRLGMPRLRVHDLRHVFATRCIEGGIDIPTVSRWLGHSDGGALAMRVYGHLRDEHSLAQAAKL